MYAMQYAITLPAGYDMGVIRHRVATRGSLLDDFPGLGLKAYLIRERGQYSAVNQYAPFYLWADVGAMSRFLWGGGGFQGIVADFGRPPVQHWTGAGFTYGPAARAPVETATLETTVLAADAAPSTAVASALRRLDSRAHTAGVHSTAVAVDPTRWELIQFTLWSVGADVPTCGQRYEVLHLSAPEVTELTDPPGRQTRDTVRRSSQVTT